jgi:hypothetical protein
MPPASPGRNDPCPCGSGKKYKKCCLAKDEAAARPPPAPRPPSAPRASGLRSESALARAPAGRDLSPAERWWDGVIDAAEHASTADEAATQLARVLAPDAPPAPRSDWLFDLLGPIFEQLARAGRHAERLRALEGVAERHPDAFGEAPAHFARLRFEAALDDGSGDLVAEARLLGPYVADVIDLVDDVPARLAWEGRTAVLRALTDAAWPGIHGSTDIMGAGVEAWADYGVGAVLLDCLDRDPAADADAPALLAGVAMYQTADAEPGWIPAFLRHYLPLLEPAGAVSLDAAQVAEAVEKRGRAALDLLDPVSAAVAARLRRERGWSRSQAWLLLREMGALLVERAEHAEKKARPKTAGALALPPEGTFLDALLARNVGMFTRKTHVILAVVSALPTWAGEVAARGWVSPDEASAWLRRFMQTLGATLAKIPADQRDDLDGLLDFVTGEGQELRR